MAFGIPNDAVAAREHRIRVQLAQTGRKRIEPLPLRAEQGARGPIQALPEAVEAFSQHAGRRHSGIQAQFEL